MHTDAEPPREPSCARMRSNSARIIPNFFAVVWVGAAVFDGMGHSSSRLCRRSGRWIKDSETANETWIHQLRDQESMWEVSRSAQGRQA